MTAQRLMIAALSATVSATLSAALMRAAPASAQWLNYPTAGIPRTAGRQTEPVGAGSANRTTASRNWRDSGGRHRV